MSASTIACPSESQLVDRAADLVGELLRVRQRAARDHDAGDALRLEVQRRQLAHLAGADDEHAPPGELSEDLSREVDGGEADRHRAFGERCLRSHALAHAECPVKQAIEQRPRALDCRRGRERVLDLTENLRLADDERVETGCDAEQMPRRVVIDVRVEMRTNALGRQLVELGQKRDQVLAARVGILARDVQLRAVARRDDDGFSGMRPARERTHGRLEAAAAEIQPLAELHGGGTVTGANQKKVHKNLPPISFQLSVASSKRRDVAAVPQFVLN